MTRFLVLQHISCEPPAVYEDELCGWDVELTRVEVDEGQSLPDWRRFDAIIAMGGPMGACDDADHPWLVPERRLIASAVAAGVPYWGVCLGAQLLAASLGGIVRRGPEPEVGVLPVECTAAGREDPVFRHLPPRFNSLQWHSDTFTLPPGARALARSETYEHQAFVVGRAYGLQFHLEVTSSLASEWTEIPAYAASLQELRGPAAAPHLLSEIARHEAETAKLARTIFAAWLGEVVGLARPAGVMSIAASTDPAHEGDR